MLNKSQQLLHELKRILTIAKVDPVREKWVAVDFDGPIHKYSKGWQGGEIYDEVSPGAIKSLYTLRTRGYKIAIHTARIVNSISIDGFVVNEQRLEDLKEYLDRNSVPYDTIVPKMVAEAYIDDRAIYCNPAKNSHWDVVLENELLCDI